MPEVPSRIVPCHYFLRLSPEDVVLLWGILDGFRERGRATKERWPRLERLLFDLDTIMQEQENADA